MSFRRSKINRTKSSIWSFSIRLPEKGKFIYQYIVIPLIIFLILFFVVDSFIMPAITRHGSEFALPDISGLNCDEAAKILESADLGMEIISKEFNSNKPEGTVISQYPPAGTKVKAGRIIKATISVGAKTAIVPPLRGFSVRQAKLNIEAAGLVMGEIAWTFSDSLPEKVVVFSYPASGTEVPGGTAVNLMVNRGRVAGAVYMPNLIGKPLDEAKKIIEEMGLKLGLVTYRRDENYLPETVIEQSAPEATELDSGEEIDLIVSTTD